MKLANEKFCIEFYDKLEFLGNNEKLNRTVSENEREILENEIVYNKFMKKALSNSSISVMSDTELWRGIGCMAQYLFNGVVFNITFARWEDNWEVTISLAGYPNFFSKIVRESLYLEKIGNLKLFSEVVFNAIKSEINPSEMSVFLSSSPKNEVDNINLLEWKLGALA